MDFRWISDGTPRLSDGFPINEQPSVVLTMWSSVFGNEKTDFSSNLVAIRNTPSEESLKTGALLLSEFYVYESQVAKLHCWFKERNIR